MRTPADASHATLQQIAAIADPVDRARALSKAIAAQQALLRDAARMRRQAIAAARAGGHRIDHLANVLGVTPSRISQMSIGPKAREPRPRG